MSEEESVNGLLDDSSSNFIVNNNNDNGELDRHDDSSSTSDLEDEDRELIYDNLGQNASGQLQLRRLRQHTTASVSNQQQDKVEEEEEEEEGEEEEEEEEDDDDDEDFARRRKRPRASAAELEKLFSDDDEGEQQSVSQQQSTQPTPIDRSMEEEDEDDDLSNFIVDEERPATSKLHGKPAALSKQAAARRLLAQTFGKHLSAQALDALLSVFGDGSDYIGMVAEDDDEDDDGNQKSFALTSKHKDQPPAALPDIPERLLDISKSQDSSSSSFQEESQWIFYQWQQPGARDQAPNGALLPIIASILNLIVNEHWEVPAIAAHRKELYRPYDLSLMDLWDIHDKHQQWLDLQRIKCRISSNNESTGLDRYPELINHIHLQRISAFSAAIPSSVSNSLVIDPALLANNLLGSGWDFGSSSHLSPSNNYSDTNYLEIIKQEHDLLVQYYGTHPLVLLAIKQIVSSTAQLSTTPTSAGKVELKRVMGTEASIPLQWAFIDRMPLANIDRDLFLHIHHLMQRDFISISISFPSFDPQILLHAMQPSSHSISEVLDSVVREATSKLILPRIQKELLDESLMQAQSFMNKSVLFAMQDRLMSAPFGGSSNSEIIPLPTSTTPQLILCATMETAILVQCSYASDPRLVLQSEKPFASIADAISFLDRTIEKHQLQHVLLVGGNAAFPLFVKELERQLTNTVAIVEVQDDTARIYAQSELANRELPNQSVVVKYCYSAVRRFCNALCEVAHFYSSNSSLFQQFALNLTSNAPLARLYCLDDVIKGAERALINVTNLVGMDLNLLSLQKSSSLTWSTAPLPFIAGLGGKRVISMLKSLSIFSRSITDDGIKSKGISSRDQLRQVCNLGPVVYSNCASFLFTPLQTKQRKSLSTDHNPLDSTRIHPENYPLAYKMVVDALELPIEDISQVIDAGATNGQLSELMDAMIRVMSEPEILDDLLLDEYANALVQRGMPNKAMTLQDIKTEFTAPFRDLRSPTIPLSDITRFAQYSNESEYSLWPGCWRLATVIAVSKNNSRIHCQLMPSPYYGPIRAPSELSIISLATSPDHTGIIRKPESGGLCDWIDIYRLQQQDNSVQFKPGSIVNVSVSALDIQLFTIKMEMRPTSGPDRVIPADTALPLGMDPTYYNFHRAHELLFKSDETVSLANHQQPSGKSAHALTRHPLFQSKATQEDLQNLLKDASMGETLFRPSASRGPKHATLTWKIEDQPSSCLFQNLDVQLNDDGCTLTVANEIFEDADEIVARHIEPMASLLRDVKATPKFASLHSDRVRECIAEIEQILKNQRQQQPNRVPYVLTLARDRPGHVLLSFEMNRRVKHEIIQVNSAGYSFRNRFFERIEPLISFFKSQ